MSRAGRRWTRKEEDYLAFHWGTRKLARLAEELGRTEAAIVQRARHLQLGAPRRGTWTLAGLAKETGYDPATLKLAATRCGIQLRRGKRSYPDAPTRPRSTRHGRWYAITEEQREAILKELAKHPDGERLHASKRGEWGGRARGREKASACADCGTTSRPHYAKDRCRPCYRRSRAD